MPGINEDRDRQVVPLWRSFRTTTSRGELAPLSPQQSNRFNDEMLADLLQDWHDFPTISVAADFVAAAFSLGRFTIAMDAAEFVRTADEATLAAKSIATLYLDKAKGSAKQIVVSSIADIDDRAHLGIDRLEQQLKKEIRETRIRLNLYPRNPILWINLARLYTSMGQHEKAIRAVRIALSLAPTNRFVLRASSRFLLHLGQKDQAHWLLARAPNVKSDPWILAAEIATAAANNITSPFIKTGKKILEADARMPFHLSELASAIGTLESLHGNIKKARKLIQLSLREPSDNAIAQAAWISRRLNATFVTGNSPTQSHEANAWIAWKNGNWDFALSETAQWQSDQPFSSRPAILGSHMAGSAVEEYALSAAFALQGLRSNPSDFTLQNNLAFAFAMQGQLLPAKRVLRNVNASQLRDTDRIAFEATRGLIAFRQGDYEFGRSCYKYAIEVGKKNKDTKQHIASIYLAMEELRIKSSNAESLRDVTLREISALKEPWELAIIQRLREYNSKP